MVGLVPYNKLMHWLDPSYIVKTFGYVGIFTIIFLESGIPIGFFLPGDSLLFAAGLLCSQHYLNIFVVMLLAIVAAILGNNAGYLTGKKTDDAWLQKSNSGVFSKKRINEAHDFFDQRGGQALVLARFIPAVRTFVPIVAGIGKMDYRHFLVFNGLGALLWGITLPALGYTIGKSVPNIDKYILPVVFIFVVISSLPIVYHFLKTRRG